MKSEVQAIEYDENNRVIPFDHGYTGEVVSRTVTSLQDIMTALSDADANPNNLYVLTYSQSGTISINTTVNLVTNGHVKIVRGSGNTDYIFTVASNGTLNIGSSDMTGTIEISGGAIFTKDASIPYVFEEERTTTRNYKSNYNNDGPRVLFNDGEDYSVAHWYKVEGATSERGLLKSNGGTINIYQNTRLGDVYQASCATGRVGAINVTSDGKLNMYGGEVSWNAMGIGNNGAGPAIYIGNSDIKDTIQLKSNVVANLYDALIQYNTAIDVGGSGNQVNSADGGAVAVDSATLNIRGGKISNNRAGSTSDIESAANGGGVSGRNGARINMYDGEISNNYTGCVGGGVCLWYSKFNMYGGTITRNYARYGGGAGMSTKSTPFGCEIILYNDATISENYAEYGGGVSAGALGSRGKNAKFIMLNGNVIDNTAIYEGGGICNYNFEKSSLDLRGGTISNNKAPAGAGVSIQNLGTANTSDYLLELSGGISINTNNDILISELKKYNSSDTTYQTPIWVKGRLNSQGTIAILSMNNYTTYVGTDLIKFKREDGGSLEVQSNKFSIDTDQYILEEIYDNSTLRLKANTVSEDTYVARNGNTIYASLKDAVNSASNGDTIYIINNTTLTETINIDKNITIVPETTKTKNDSNVVDSNLKNPQGGSVNGFTYQPLGDYTISLVSSFDSNTNNTSAFVVKPNGVLTFGDAQYEEEDITISLGGYLALDGNSGHAINGSLIDIEDGGRLEANAGTIISNNKSTTGINGAGIHVASGASAIINGAIVQYNTSPSCGAGIYVEGNLTMNAGHINENEAVEGAGIYVADGGSASIYTGEIDDNVASHDGAGIYVADGGSIVIHNATISNNNATNDGGGIYVSDGASFEMRAGEVRANRTVNGNGAGMYLDGTAIIKGGRFDSNVISSFNTSPKGSGILVNAGGELHISKDIYLDRDNPVYLTSGEYLYLDDSLTMSGAIPIQSEDDTYGTKIAKINTQDESVAEEIETITLRNKSIYEIKNDNPIIGKTENDMYWLVYDSIDVTYHMNNGKSGDVPVDNEAYSGGDLVSIKPVSSENPLTRDGYVFMGWSTVQVSPITSAANELSVTIYYPTELIEGVIYQNQYTIFEDTVFYAVWAVDANHNTVPDYRENVLNITIAPSENGAMSSSLDKTQGGMFVLLTAAPADGYEVDTIEVRYTLNGVEGVYSLENNRVIRLDEKLFYFNMPLADATVYTTFKVQTINEVKITWNDGSEEEWGTLQSALNEIKANTTKQGKKITLLKYVYSRIAVDIPEDINIEFDLAGYTLDMNYLPFVINEGATLKISDGLSGGKISFNSTGGNNNTPNNIVNNGTLNITDGQILMDAGEESTHVLIQNNGTLTMSGGSLKHNDTNGIAIYNDGQATLTGGNINGGKYGVYQANTTANSLDISGFGPINTYGVNLDHYLSSIYVSKDTFVNVSGVINNCAEDNSVSESNLIPLYLDEQIGLNEPIIKSNRVETMVKHFRMHFGLANRPNQVIAVNTSNEAVLIEKPGKIFTEAQENEYQYRTNMTLNAQLYQSDNTTPYVGATGTVYFFLLDTVAQWHDVWRPDLNQLVFREGWGLENAVGSASIDSETGLATCIISTEDLDLQNYYIFAMYYGDGTYDTYSVDGPVSSGFVGPIVAKNEQQGQVELVQKDIDAASVTVTSTASKMYNGSDQKANIEIEVHDGEILLIKDTDYEISMPSSIVGADDYTITVLGTGKYENARTVTFTVTKYDGQIAIEGIGLNYPAGTVPSISFDGASPTATVRDSYQNILEHGTDYDISYYKMNTATEQYEEISALQSTAGIYKVVATCKEASQNYTSGITAEATFVILSEGALYTATIENGTTTNPLVYNGRERTIDELGTITVSGKASSTAPEETLTRDTDYTVSFGTSSVKNAGTYSMIIQGRGDYADLVNLAVDVTIAKKELTKNNTTIIFDNEDLEYEYSSKAIIPTIQNISIDGVDLTSGTGTPLVYGVDYITSISGDNLKVQAHDPEFLFTTLNGNYEVTTLDYSFHIAPRSLANNENVSVSIYQSGFTGEEIVPVVTVLDRVGGTSKKLTDEDYEVTYRISDVENNTATLTNHGYPLNKGTYDAIITGKGNYTGQKIETVVIGNYRGRIIAELDPNVFTYTGNESALHGSILNALTVTRGDNASVELIYGTDYTLGYGAPENTVAPSEVGEYLLYIVGIGNYDQVQTTTTYQISPLTGTVHIELDTNSIVYNGKIQLPTIDKTASYMLVNGEEVYLSSLEEGRDYSLIVDENSSNVGGYILQVNGVGRYAGNYNFVGYQITPRSINDENITIKSIASTDKEYNGQPQTLSFHPSGDAWIEYKYDANEAPMILVENRDFTVVHSNNTNGGTAVVVIAGNGNFGDVRTNTFVIESKPINSGDALALGFTLTGIENKSYSGAVCTQDIVLTDTILSAVLVEGVDYTVTYTDNVEVGTASYKIEGKGNYKGTIRGTFEIMPISIHNNPNVTIEVTNNNNIYNTAAQRPSVSVKYSRNGTLIQLHEDTDFEVVHGTNEYVNAGNYTFSIKGKDGSNYTDSEEVQYTIAPYTGNLNVSLSHSIYTNGVTKQEIENNLVVSYGSETLSTDDLDITYTPEELTTGNYTIQVKAKEALSNYYASSASRASGYTLFTIEGAEEITLSLTESSHVYTAGTIVVPESHMIINDTNSVEELREANHELTYMTSWDRTIKEVGTYTLTVKVLKGNNLLQSATATYEVLPKDINASDVTSENIEDQIYVGTYLKPEVRLEYNEEVLTTNDYTVVYSNNKNVGEATITLVGKGNYTGTKELTFEIIRESQGDTIITLLQSGEEVTNSTYTYDGFAKTPEVAVDYVVTVGERIELEEGRDYKVSFENNSNAGTAKAIVTLCGNYSGESFKEFKINKFNLSNATIEIENSTVYNGKVQKPRIDVKRGNVVLEKDEDYEVAYDGSFIDADTYSVILIRALSGDNCNYNGEQQITYTIHPYGNNSGETLLLDFVDDKTSYKEGTIADTNVFKNLLIVKDLNGNTLPSSNYIVAYAPLGSNSYSETFPQGVGTYTVKVTGAGVNYAGNYDMATRDFVIYLRTANVSNASATYKNAIYTISEIVSSITITSEDDSTVVLNKNNFNISFGSTEPKQVGNYTVIASGKEGTSYEGILATGVFTIEPALIVFSSVSDRTYCCYSHEPDMTISGVAGEEVLYKKDYMVTYSGDNYAESDVPPTNAGLYNVTVEGMGNYQGKTTKTYRINPASLDSNDVVIEITNNESIYNTEEQEPIINVIYRFEHGVKKLSASEIAISPDNVSYTNAGVYEGEIVAVSDNYTDSKEFTYTIKPYVGTLDVTLSESAYENGVSQEEVLENLTVKYLNEVIPSGDYEVEFSSDTLTPGNHTLSVTAKDSKTNYSDGTAKASGFVTFTVEEAASINVTLSSGECVYTAKTIAIEEADIFVNGVSVEELKASNNGLNYEVTGINGIKDVGTYTITVNVLKGNTIIQTDSATFEVTKKDIADDDLYEMPIEDQIYTGSKLYPEFKLAQNGVILTSADYEAVYSDNTNVGIATITLVGQGNYKGSREIKFHIVEASEGTIIVTLKENGELVNGDTYVYDGTAKTPEVLVEYITSGERKTLEAGVDYHVSFEDNINATTTTTRAKAVVTLCGNYSGSSTKEFMINRFDLANTTVSTTHNVSYNGQVQYPNVFVKRGSTLLIKDVDYEVTYIGSYIDAGQYDVVLNAVENGNYCGEETIHCIIQKYGLSENEVLLLTFSDDKAVFSENITQAQFEQKLSVKDINGNTLSSSNYTVTYSTNGATFTEEFPQGVGTYTVKVTGTGTNYAGQYDTSEREFVISVDSVTVSDAEKVYKNAVYTVSDILAQITISSTTGSIPVSYFDISFGRSTPKDVGTYTVLVYGKSDTDYAGVISAGEFDITPASLTVSSIDDTEYIGMPVNPSITVSGIGGESVILGKDYTITYSGDSYLSKDAPTSVGDYEAIVEGVGNYTGTTHQSFSITPIQLNGAAIHVTVTNNNTIYDTTVQAPVLDVTYETENGIIRLKDDDYEIVHGDNGYQDADDYIVTVRAKADSNYSGEKAVTYTVKPYVGQLNVSLAESTYTNGVTKEEVLTDLEVKYLDEVIPHDKLDITFTPNTLTTGNYTIEVKAKDTITNYYESEASRANGYVLFTIVGEDSITITLDETSHVYTAKTITIPDSSIKVNNDKTVEELRALNPTLTYEVTWSSTIKDVGTYIVTLRVFNGENELQKATATYTVTVKDIGASDVVAASIADQIYTGLEIEPAFTVTYNGVNLTASDYTVIYKDNVSVGIGKINLVGKGNFEGVKEITFNITEAASGDIVIGLKENGATVTNSTYTYDGTAKTPEIVVEYVVDANRITLEANKDYEVTYQNNVESGTAKAIVTLCGNYSGSEEKEYVINQYDLENALVEIGSNVVYNGSEQKPQVQVKRLNVLLVEDTDYEITYDGGFIEAGTYDVIITAKDDSNYQGEVTKTFTIRQYGLSSGEELLVEFANGNASYIKGTTQTAFENNLVVKDLNGNTLSSSNYVVTYSLNGTNFASTYPSEVGTYTVKVTGTGFNYAGQNDVATRKFVLYIDKVNGTNVSKAFKDASYTISDILADMTLTDDNGTTLSKENFTISFGSIAPKDVGSYTIMITGNAGTGYEGVLGTATFTITPISLLVEDLENVTYNGTSNPPELTITGENGEEVELGKDYTISYTGTDVENETYTGSIAPTKAGDYTVTITGKGNYEGTINKDYRIEKVEAEELSGRLSETEFAYNKQSRIPTEFVTYTAGDNTLVLRKGTDYEVSYQKQNESTNNFETITATNSKEVGNYQVVITTKGNYEGSFTLPYAIVSATASFQANFSHTSKTYNKQAQSATISVIGDGETLVLNTDYTVTYYMDSTCTTMTNTQNSGASGNGKAPKNAKTYYILVQGIGNYEGKEAKSEFVILPKEISDDDITVGAIANQTYTGTSLEPSVNVSWGATLTEGTDYEVSFANNQEIGTATVTIRGMGNYTGRRTSTFKIVSISGGEIAITLGTNSYIYDGTAKEPAVSVTYNGETLSANDYIVEYTENVNAGEATVLVTLKGNYVGTQSTTFTITPANLEDLAITITPSEVTYTGSEQKGAITVKQGDTLLMEGTDYTVSYEGDFTNVGEHTVMIQAVEGSNYTGSQEASTTIAKYGEKAEDTLLLTFADDNASYEVGTTKETIEANLVVKDLNRNTLTTDDYVITYENESGEEISFPTAGGTYTIKVTGTGDNYAGENDVASRKIAIYISKVNATNVTKEYKNAVYTIDEILSEITLSLEDGTEVTQDIFEITFGGISPKDVGEYTIVIAGKEGTEASQVSGTATFTITATELTVEDIEDVTYDGTANSPELTITGANGEEAVEGKDYTVSYTGTDSEGNAYTGTTAPTKAGDYTVTVTGKGNYEGSEVSKEYTIQKASSDDLSAVLSETELTYNKAVRIPTEIVTFEAGENTISLKKTVDYDVTYQKFDEDADDYVAIEAEESVDEGRYQVVITAKGNYEGEITLDYQIIAFNRSFDVQITESSKVYTGEPQGIELTVKEEDTVLEEGVDYTITYYKDAAFTEKTTEEDGAEDEGMMPAKVGKYYVKVEGIGAYEGKVYSAPFEIKKKQSASGGGGGSTVIEKVEVGIDGDVTEIIPNEDTSLLNKTNHDSYINGYSDGTFRPNRNMTRAEVAAILARLLVVKPTITNLPFSDVEGHWAKEAILMMSSLGIVNGYTDGTFRPENLITRAEFATMMARFEDITHVKAKAYFSDVDESHWAFKTISFAKVMGWISGYADGTFKPNHPITRAEAVTIVNRYLGRFNDVTSINEHASANKFTDITGHWAYYNIMEATITHDHETENGKETWAFVQGDGYKILYHMNDNEGKIYRDNTIYEEGEKVNLPSKVTSKQKKTFAGWALEEDGEVVESYRVDSNDANSEYEISFYAIWQ